MITVRPVVTHTVIVPARRFTPGRPIRRGNESLALAPARHPAPADPIAMIGHVTGSIEYADDQLVLFGSNGTLRINNDRTATLILPDGKMISFDDRANSIRQLAARSQVQM